MTQYKELEPGLLISSDGRVFKEATYTHRGNTRTKYSCINWLGERTDVHRLVAKAFLPNPSNLPIVMHKDSNSQNNSISNLMWGTYQQNVDQCIAESRNPKLLRQSERYFKMFEMWIDGKSHREIAAAYSITEARVSQIVSAYFINKII